MNIEYNNIKDRNIFYFKYYCQDKNEFEEWLEDNSIYDIYDEFRNECNEPYDEEYECWTEIYK